MYVTDRIAFLQLQKTGCSHITRALEIVTTGRQYEMHGRCPGSVLESGRLIAGSVRDPWDWYVSLWGYGCDGRGVLHNKLTEKKKVRGHGYRNSLTSGLRLLYSDLIRRRRFWKRVYSDVESPGNFRLWLKNLNSKEGASAVKGDYSRSTISSFAGFLTFRFCRLFLNREELLYDGSITSPQELQRALESRNILQYTIKMEHITEGILEMLRISGTIAGDDELERIKEMQRTNPSSRRKDFSFYYDEETVELIQKRDRLIAEGYGYSPPEIS